MKHDAPLKELLKPLRPLASDLGISYQAIHKWRRVPASRVLEIERLRGIDRSRLRPDLYPIGERAA